MMRARWLKLLTVAVACGLVALAVLVSDEPVPVVPRHPRPPVVVLPAAVISMGDSTLSGEGAGVYVPGTDGQDGNWCHRSPYAPVFETHLPSTVTPINLACSGAKAAQVGNVSDPTASGTQTQKLAELTKRYQIKDIVVQVGANDEPDFSDTVNKCVAAWASRTAGGCASQLSSAWPQRVQEMEPKVLSALRAVQAVMTRAGYRPGSYSLIVQSYASPVTPGITPQLQNLSGCPLLSSDLQWIRYKAVPDLSSGLHQVAQEAGARFLDLSQASDGHGACTPSQWFNPLTVDWQALKVESRAPHAMQASFHANIQGQAEFGGCLGEFLSTQETNAACVLSPQGNLEATENQTLMQGPHP
jgi:hypothetical protein